MSGIEIVVVLFGLFLGYWVVSKFTPNHLSAQKPSDVDRPHQSELDPHRVLPPAWHEVLNVSPSATVEDIRRAYEVMKGRYQPDKVVALGDELIALAERKSTEITGAYIEAMRLRGVDP